MLVAALLALTAAFAATAAHATLVLYGRIILITSGSDAGGIVTGSTFIMREARGTPITNSSTGRTYTLLTAGSTGLALLAYTEAASPAFDARGNSLTSSIIQPTLFDGVLFSVATPRVDPITRATNDLPSILVDLTAGRILVDLGAWTAYWNSQTFNQGSRAVTVTSFSLRPSRIVLDWSAPITEGPFRGFIGNWHIEGTVL